MALDDLVKDFLAPVKWVDEQIERQYAKVRKSIDDKGINVYLVATFMNISVLFTYPMIKTIPVGFAAGTYAGMDMNRNIVGLFKIKRDNVTDGKSVAVYKDDNIFGKITNSLRLPVFLTGVGFMSTGIYQSIDGYLLSKDSQNAGEGMKNMFTGLGWLCQASSVYLKNSDPKLLQKDPFWKTAYNWAKEKLSEFVPQPTPVPIPIKKSVIFEYYSLNQ